MMVFDDFRLLLRRAAVDFSGGGDGVEVFDCGEGSRVFSDFDLLLVDELRERDTPGLDFGMGDFPRFGQRGECLENERLGFVVRPVLADRFSNRVF